VRNAISRLGRRVRYVVEVPGRVRRVLFWASVVTTVWSFLISAVFERETAAPGLSIVLPVVVVLCWRLWQWHSMILAIAAGFVAIYVPDAVFLWPAVTGMVYVSVADDPADVPWLAWVAGLVGSVTSLVVYSYAATPAPFLAVALGGALGILVRSFDRSDRLAGETRRLRGQAAWLEQRTSLARELHDVVGHHVTAMVVQAEAGLVGDPERALREIGGLGRTALGELDALVVHLRDPQSPLSVSAAPRLSDIDELLAAPLRQQGVAVTVEVDPEADLDEATTLTAYRIVQEALTNVARHARATQAWVEVAAAGSNVRLRVSDDGLGPPDEVTRGSGLIGIAERVTALGGVWSIGRRPGGGTIVDAYLPVAR
jgi:signal transduction histidine kinase